MEEDKSREDQDKGFAVRDKRFTAKKEEDSRIKEERTKEAPSKEGISEKDISEKDIPLPEINFTSFLFSISTSALIQLGEIQDPLTQQFSKNLPLAKQTIDLIGMLKEKTKGNLTSDEERMIENILYDLRMRYVKAVG